MSYSNQNLIPSSRHIQRNIRNNKKQEKQIRKTQSKGDVVINGIANGDFDNYIIENFKYLKLDLKKSVSGAKWEDRFSTYRKLAENMGFNPNDDRIVRELYRVVMYNKRFIRDQLETKNEEVKGSFKSVIHVEIKLPDPANRIFTVTPVKDGPVHFDMSSHIHVKHDPVKIVKGPQPLSEVQHVDWGLQPVEQTCQRCSFYGFTKIQYRIGCCTWCWVLSLIISGICLPCSWFPCALNCTKDTLHICPRCLFILGLVPRNICIRKIKAIKDSSSVTHMNQNKILRVDKKQTEIRPMHKNTVSQAALNDKESDNNNSLTDDTLKETCNPSLPAKNEINIEEGSDDNQFIISELMRLNIKLEQ